MPGAGAVVTETPEVPADTALAGKPQNRANIGNVQLAFDRYENSRPDLVALANQFKSQPWYKDGLTREESLFVERGLTFVARYSGPRTAYVSDETIVRKLIKYEKVDVKQGQVELLLIYEPGQDAEREMALIKRSIQVLEDIVGVQYPASVMTVVNGQFEINDFNESEFIRIARCCVNNASVLAHEVSHTYWSMGPSWFNEGMADVYSVMVLEKMSDAPPPGWTPFRASIDAFYKQRKPLVEGGRFPDMVLSRRFAQDGLYEVASVFVMDLRNTLGPEGFANTVKDIYLQSDYGRYNLREKRLEDVFLQHAKGAQADTVKALFNKQVWGDNGEKYQQLVDQE